MLQLVLFFSLMSFSSFADVDYQCQDEAVEKLAKTVGKTTRLFLYNWEITTRCKNKVFTELETFMFDNSYTTMTVNFSIENGKCVADEVKKGTYKTYITAGTTWDVDCLE